MWYTCAHVHIHVSMCVYMCEYVQRPEAGSGMSFSIVLHTFFRQSHTEPGTYGFHKISCTASPRDFHALPPYHWDYKHMLLRQAFLIFPYLYTMKYDHIYPHFPPSNLLLISLT